MSERLSDNPISYYLTQLEEINKSLSHIPYGLIPDKFLSVTTNVTMRLKRGNIGFLYFPELTQPATVQLDIFNSLHDPIQGLEITDFQPQLLINPKIRQLPESKQLSEIAYSAYLASCMPFSGYELRLKDTYRNALKFQSSVEVGIGMENTYPPDIQDIVLIGLLGKNYMSGISYDDWTKAVANRVKPGQISDELTKKELFLFYRERYALSHFERFLDMHTDIRPITQQKLEEIFHNIAKSLVDKATLDIISRIN